MIPRSPSVRAALAALLLPAVALASPGGGGGTPPARRAAPLYWNHGPGTSGGGTSTLSGETLRHGRWEVSLSTDYTDFENVSRSRAEAKAGVQGEFDALKSSLVQRVGVAYGVTDDLQVGAEIGYYLGSDFIDAEDDGAGGVESASADPEGLTDLWLSAKWRAHRGPSGHVALIGGVKLPTGKDDETLDNGEVLEPSSQPGSGALDFQAGVAWSRYLNERVTMDASGLYTLRTEHDDFRVGDRVDLGLALAYRLTPDVATYPNSSVFGELTTVVLGEDEEGGEANDHSGGTTVYLAAGARVRLNEHVALSLAPALPVAQDLNGDQVETDWKVAFQLTYTP